MDAKLSEGYGSEFVVIDARTQHPVSNAVVLFPQTDKLAFDAIVRYLERHKAPMPKLADKCKQWASEWERIDTQSGGRAT